MIYFNGLANVEGWKLTPAGDWNNGEWGMSGTPAAEAPTQTLVTSGGGNITTYSHNSYYIEFNTTTCELKVSQAYPKPTTLGASSATTTAGARATPR